MALTLTDFIRQMRDAAITHPEIATYLLTVPEYDLAIGDVGIHSGSREIRLFTVGPEEDMWDELPEPPEEPNNL